MKKLVILFILAGVTLLTGQSDKLKVICKSTRLGPYAVAVSCTNGSDVTGRKIGDTVILSCGKDK